MAAIRELMDNASALGTLVSYERKDLTNSTLEQITAMYQTYREVAAKNGVSPYYLAYLRSVLNLDEVNRREEMVTLMSGNRRLKDAQFQQILNVAGTNGATFFSGVNKQNIFMGDEFLNGLDTAYHVCVYGLLFGFSTDETNYVPTTVTAPMILQTYSTTVDEKQIHKNISIANEFLIANYNQNTPYLKHEFSSALMVQKGKKFSLDIKQIAGTTQNFATNTRIGVTLLTVMGSAV